MNKDQLLEQAPDINLAEAETTPEESEDLTMEMETGEPSEAPDGSETGDKAPPEEQTAEPEAPQQPEPELPDWMRDDFTPPQAQPEPPKQGQQGDAITPEQLKMVLEALVGQQGPTSPGAATPPSDDGADILSRLLTNPKGVLNEVVAPLMKQVEAMQRYMEMQTTAQIRTMAESAKQRLAEGFKKAVLRHPVYAGDDEVKKAVDEIAKEALADAVMSSMRDGPAPVQEINNPDYPLLLLALGAYRAGKLGQLLSGNSGPPPAEAAQAAAGMPTSPGAAAEAEGTELPSDVTPDVVQALRRIGITEDQLRKQISKYGWEE